jgi:uncharacterized protein
VDLLTQKLRDSPILARVVPFVIFIALTACQGWFGEASRYWIYLAKTLAGAWLVWSIRLFVTEMRWAVSWEAVVVGIAVFAMWVGLDGFYPKLGKPGSPWNPHEQFGQGSALAWLFMTVRIGGSALVVPPLEEVFYRSFLYRYIIKVDFLSVPLKTFHWTAFLVTSAVFGFEHSQWLAGILCGFAYQGLVCWKGRLGDAMTAHGITNLLLGLWVVGKDAWQFW